MAWWPGRADGAEAGVGLARLAAARPARGRRPAASRAASIEPGPSPCRRRCAPPPAAPKRSSASTRRRSWTRARSSSVARRGSTGDHGLVEARPRGCPRATASSRAGRSGWPTPGLVVGEARVGGDEQRIADEATVRPATARRYAGARGAGAAAARRPGRRLVACVDADTPSPPPVPPAPLRGPHPSAVLRTVAWRGRDDVALVTVRPGAPPPTRRRDRRPRRPGHPRRGPPAGHRRPHRRRAGALRPRRLHRPRPPPPAPPRPRRPARGRQPRPPPPGPPPRRRGRPRRRRPGLRAVLAPRPRRARRRPGRHRPRPGSAVADDGGVVGYAVTGRSAARGYLQRLAVDPERWRQGVGAALVVDGLRWLRRRHVRVGRGQHPGRQRRRLRPLPPHGVRARAPGPHRADPRPGRRDRVRGSPPPPVAAVAATALVGLAGPGAAATGSAAAAAAARRPGARRRSTSGGSSRTPGSPAEGTWALRWRSPGAPPGRPSPPRSTPGSPTGAQYDDSFSASSTTGATALPSLPEVDVDERRACCPTAAGRCRWP